MAAGSGVVSQPDSVVLHALRSIGFLDLLDFDDLTVSLLDLLQLGEKVPETRLGDNVIGREDGHAKQRWIRNLRGGQVTTHNAVLTELQTNKHTILENQFKQII